ncbi:hypothetical protein ACFY04_25865 [Streptomyces sp. NPDC001549]|uniref:hypothetical protein n=1 Tax=Streptomyces sp. NPDC001549 TaxID=3364586 RepID=UPI00369C1008
MTVHGTYLGPDSRPLAGTVTFSAPSMLTFPDSDLFIAGPVVASLDENGRFETKLPATDAPNMDPSKWSYVVKENLSGVIGGRIFSLLLPKAKTDVDLADLAPSDPTTPNYVPVVGSQIFTGGAIPTAALGRDGDFYTQYDTRTLLGVTHTTVTMWTRAAGTWVKVGGDVRGSQWYLNNTTTPSTDAKPGDVLLRTDTGDIWQRGPSGWGSAVGNLKGPKGDKGDIGLTGGTGPAGPQGPKGDKGDAGTGSGTVTSVNGKVPNGAGAVALVAADVGAGTGTVKTVNAKTPDGAGNVALAASDVGAVANTVPVTAKATAAATDPFRVVDDADAQLFGVRKTGSTITPLGNAYFNKNVRIGGSASAAGVGTAVNGVLAIDNGTGPSAANAAGVHLYANAGQLMVQEQSGRAFSVNEGTRNTWTPDALGFEAWSVDPGSVANPTALKAAIVQRLYMCAVNITEPTSVGKVVIHARGWAGSTTVPAARFFAGIYNEAGSRVAWTGATALSAVAAAGQISGSPASMVNNHIGAVPLPLTAAYVMQPGRYWLAFLMSAGSATDFYYFHIQNESPSNPSNFFLGTTAFARNWYLSGQTTLPATVTSSAGLTDHDPPIMAVAV